MKYVIKFLGVLGLSSKTKNEMLYLLLNKRFKVGYNFYAVASLNELYKATKSPKMTKSFLDHLMKLGLVKICKDKQILIHYTGKLKKPIIFDITALSIILQVLEVLSSKSTTVKEKRVKHSIYTTFEAGLPSKNPLAVLLSSFNKHKKQLTPTLSKAFSLLIITYKALKNQEVQKA